MIVRRKLRHSYVIFVARRFHFINKLYNVIIYSCSDLPLHFRCSQEIPLLLGATQFLDVSIVLFVSYISVCSVRKLAVGSCSTILRVSV